MTDEGTWVEAFEAPVEEATLDLVQDRLEAFWTRAVSVEPTERMKLEMAFVEIVGNIIEHAFAVDTTDGGRILSVVLRADADSIEAVISDNGLPTALDLGSVTMPDEDAVSGRGLALTVAAVDEMRYERVDGRNHWTLRLARQSG
ncbi:ATP-binding protein [Nocardioides sp.]|uniref:ATP-binding protein n=1 Tax=Nocardioides sp. TaxID=35761 RepID=UPI002C405497|nr:ATP-binding protein [Nocardioides sp.]HXH79310.1 ATP-binding protein [Nocardioides sp.]